MRNEKLAESAEEKGRPYSDMLQELGTCFLQNRKRFKFALNRVSGMLMIHEFEHFKTLSQDRDMEDSGSFEDRFEEICWEKGSAEKRELVRLMLRHL